MFLRVILIEYCFVWLVGIEMGRYFGFGFIFGIRFDIGYCFLCNFIM